MEVNINVKAGSDNKADGSMAALLREWPDIEPDPGFETAVWHAIMTEAPVEVKSGRMNLFGEWMIAHRFAAGMAAALTAIIISGAAGWFAARNANSGLSGLQVVETRSLAGAYIAMATGLTR